MDRRTKAKAFEVLANLFALIWIITIPVALWFVGSALFFHGPWTRVIVTLILGWVCKNMLFRGFDAHKNRFGYEQALLTVGVPEAEARNVALNAMNGDAKALAMVQVALAPRS